MIGLKIIPGEIIYKHRMKAGLTQEQLGICVHKSTIKDYENNKIKGKTKTLEKFIRISGTYKWYI